MNIISITQAHRKTSHTIIESDDDSDIEMDDQGIITRTGTGTGASSSLVVTPGELITSDPTWMKGHGTYYLTSSSTTTTDENNNNNNSEMPTYSSLAGTIQKVNKLLTVVPFKGRYKPETGDHIIGRITGISVKRWKVDIGGERSATLLLGSVNLPGGVLRRKTEADELQMRSFLKEGDLVNCEVQNGGGDGGCMLHTRSLKYGKLRNGVFVKVPSGLIVRSKNHSFDLPGGVSIILGVNGFCWIGMTKRDGSGNSNSSGNVIGNNLKTEAGLTQKSYEVGKASGSITRLEEEWTMDIYSDKNDPISKTIRENISRYKNCLEILSYCNIGISETRLVKIHEISLGYGDINELVDNDIKQRVGNDLIENEKMRG